MVHDGVVRMSETSRSLPWGLFVLQVVLAAVDLTWKVMYLPKTSTATIPIALVTALLFVGLAWLTLRHIWALYVRAAYSALGIFNVLPYLVLTRTADQPREIGDFALWFGGFVLNLVIGVLCLVVAKRAAGAKAPG